ncbi:MAG: TIGR00645 family protein [Alphaproteobacteria bacterium]
MAKPDPIESTKNLLERALEGGLFASRWLMAPFYVGLVGALIALMGAFFQDLGHSLPGLLVLEPNAAILLALSLIDLSLAANLVLIVIFSGYENFVSKIDAGRREDRPEWMGTIDFSALKLKLIASIVAISGIALLKAFLELSGNAPVDANHLKWMVIIHLTFIASGVLLALMDWLSSRTGKAH